VVHVSGSDGWRRSSRCADAACVEVDSSTADGVVLVRNSARPDVALSLTTGQWRALVDAVRSDALVPPVDEAMPDSSDMRYSAE
jgi:hypothetical protein